MIRCGLCQKLSKPGEKVARVVTKTRKVIYPFRAKAHLVVKEGKQSFTDDPGGIGREIVKEVLAHKTCAYPTGGTRV